MLANLPLIPCTRAEFLSVLTMRSSILAAAWLSETFAENGSVTTNWRLASSVAIGTTAISEYSPRSRRCASKSACPCSARTRSGQSCKSSPVMGWRAEPLWAREYALRARASGASKHRARPNRAETEAWSLQMKAYGGPAQPSPTIGECLNGGFAWLEIECKRCKTRASLPLDAIRRPRNMPIWKLAAALKCRSCRQRELSPVAMPTARRFCKSSPVMGWRAAPLWAREYALRARASGASKHRPRPNRAETEAWSLQMKAYGGPAQPSPTIGQCLNGGFAWL